MKDKCLKCKNLKCNCIYCKNYSCLKCDKHIFDNVDSVCCDKCDKWIHKTCANISDKNYKGMQKNKPGEEIWLCIRCLDFPFSNIDNKKLLLLHENENNLTTNIDLITKFSITCSICLHKLGKPLKGIPCNCCKSLVHRRCSKLKPSEIRDLSKTKNYIWECLYCKKEKFPFVELDCNELEQESFNSLYSCKCLKNTDFTTEKDKDVFHYTPIYDREDEKSILTDTSNFLELFTIQPSFDYFQTHDFHKLIQKK